MSYLTTNCFCCWTDFLGFGENFEKGSWTFASEICQANIERLRAVWRLSHTTPSAPDEVALFLNDGVARIFDVTEQTRSPKRVLCWFALACNHHITCSRADAASGFAGARGVLSYGERVLLGEEMQSLSDFMIGSVEAHRRFGGKICVYSPKEFQLNLAFARAYIIETAGKADGLEHPALYVDGAALDALVNLVNDMASEELIGRGCDLSQVAPVKCHYRVERNQFESLLILSVLRKAQGEFERFLEFVFATPAIPFNKRGIVTPVYRLVRGWADDRLIRTAQNIFLEGCSV